MSLHEKSLWLMFFSLILIFGVYFATTVPARPERVLPDHIGLFAGLVVLLIVIQVAGAILLAILDKLSGTSDGRYSTDERDKLIALKSTRNAGYVLAAGVCLSLGVALVVDGNFAFTHVLLGSWVVSQLVEIGSQLFLYRRGA